MSLCADCLEPAQGSREHQLRHDLLKGAPRRAFDQEREATKSRGNCRGLLFAKFGPTRLYLGRFRGCPAAVLEHHASPDVAPSEPMFSLRAALNPTRPAEYPQHDNRLPLSNATPVGESYESTKPLSLPPPIRLAGFVYSWGS